MNVFSLPELVASVRAIIQWQQICECFRVTGRGGQQFGAELHGRMLADVRRANDVCAKVGFGGAAQKIGLIHQRLEHEKSQVDYSYVSAELLNVYDSVLESTTRHRFLRVRMSGAACIDNPNLLGTPIADAFKSAKPDIIEAGNCLVWVPEILVPQFRKF